MTICRVRDMTERRPLPSHFKKHILRRQNYKCNCCFVTLDVYDIDHIVPYCIQPRHILKNLQALCPTCHARKTRKEASELSLFRMCNKTKSYRYCWKCKKVVSSYFGYKDGKCSNPVTEDGVADIIHNFSTFYTKTCLN